MAQTPGGQRTHLLLAFSECFLAQFGVGVSQLTHIFLAMMVFLHVIPLFGIDGMCFDYDTQAVPCALTNLAFVAILGKEMITFFLVLDMQKPTDALDIDSPGVKLHEMLGEPILLVFGMLMFTFIWGEIFQDGESLNVKHGFNEAFNFQISDGEPFFFYSKDGEVGFYYDGRNTTLGYTEIPHYLCCSASAFNPLPAEKMVSFYATKEDIRYYVEIGAFK